MRHRRRHDICGAGGGWTKGQHQRGPGIANIAAGKGGLPALTNGVAQAASVYCDPSTVSYAPNASSSVSATCGINYSDGSVWKQKATVTFDSHGRPVTDSPNMGTEVSLPAAGGLPGRSERTRSIYREALEPLLEHIGLKPLRELTARDVRRGLEALSGKVSTRYLQMARGTLARAIRYAEAHDLVGRNVATLVDNPTGQIGRPSRSFTLAQSLALLEAARESRLNAYVVLSLAVGIRTEEARELHRDHVDLDGDPSAARPVPPSVAVWHSVRQGGDTKTAKSRRTLALPHAAVRALREHRKRQAEDRLAAGSLRQDHGLVFASVIGTPLDAANVRREFRKITEAAGLGTDWAPRDLRHTFVSLMSADGVPIEEIARMAGHNRTATTELVHRHELRPVIITGAEVMDRILNLRS